MKKIYNVLLSLFLMTMISSCLKAGLEELPAYEDADITSLNIVGLMMPRTECV